MKRTKRVVQVFLSPALKRLEDSIEISSVLLIRKDDALQRYEECTDLMSKLLRIEELENIGLSSSQSIARSMPEEDKKKLMLMIESTNKVYIDPMVAANANIQKIAKDCSFMKNIVDLYEKNYC
jgi:hypothetical protein